MITRRDMIKSSLENAALVALSPTVPTFLAQTARAAATQVRRPGPGRHPA